MVLVVFLLTKEDRCAKIYSIQQNKNFVELAIGENQEFLAMEVFIWQI